MKTPIHPLTDMRDVLPPMAGRPLRSGVSLDLLGASSPGRGALEAEIRDCYAHHFGARVEEFMPWLLRVTCREDGARGVIGLRPASRERLYLEDYLSRPVEEAIAAVAGQPVPRTAVVEIGQLAVESRHVVVPLFRELVPFLLQQGFGWVCFTATGPVRSLLAKAGLAGCELAAAREACVTGRQDAWGDYYRHDPRVIVGDLQRPSGFRCTPVDAACRTAGAGA
ncbi:thermostable hemolysin [Lentisalinibacter salinarum]|uniref:thermostable hemolysin n=1 Tax=Lentisalinibacter salinarum TaxID=2992239 RepID=UPI00386C9C2B